jgi:16S rRNA (cytidine1402-2'-O)-methyltransferase
MTHLYIVSTPIGNLGDISYRAVEVLRAAARILAEDTRRTRILVRHYGIDTPLISLHAHNEAERQRRVLGWLDAGEELALVSDAGTPLLSDPGARIVQAVLRAGHGVVPVPGPSAALAALVASGMEVEPFTFFGFTPRAGRARSERLAAVGDLEHTAVLYESPARLSRLLQDLEKVCGPERPVAVARELTKVHEEIRRGTMVELAGYYREHPVRGEVVVVVGGRPSRAVGLEVDEAAAFELAAALLSQGERPTAAARELARRTGLSRQRAYGIVQSAAGGGLEG